MAHDARRVVRETKIVERFVEIFLKAEKGRDGVEISRDDIEPFVHHLADFRVADWDKSPVESEFVPHQDDVLPRGVKLAHNLGTTILTFGDKIKKNMALSSTEPPQIVQYRQVRIRSASTIIEVLIEEHWLTELMERYHQLSNLERTEE